MTKQNKLNWKEIQKSLHSKEDKIFYGALKKLEKNGESNCLNELINIIHRSSDEKRIDALFTFLSRLKKPGSEKTMIEIAKESKNEPIKNRLLNSFWNSGLDYTPYFSDFVDFAVNGNYITALECLTIIENLKGPLKEEQILDAQLSLKSYLERKKEKDEKAPLISEIAIFIKETNQQLSDLNPDFFDS